MLRVVVHIVYSVSIVLALGKNRLTDCCIHYLGLEETRY